MTAEKPQDNLPYIDSICACRLLNYGCLNFEGNGGESIEFMAAAPSVENSLHRFTVLTWFIGSRLTMTGSTLPVSESDINRE